ncbi:hypothetical protein U14_01382 [Candidatus Moduliflexus flocculans]|uniref:HTH cro/C1-type domain-containing protein n=1 Tax=Candidatus Moduliflexus flocculans TaxID=1499966 RepID=A0A0S6VRZ4_9BACT|nr:hypothetical protein U14_01382 [Candidatus Moduliflexus flocculans]
MNTPIENMFNDVETFFESPATTEEKAWGLIHDFYHLVLTYMEEQQISKADLSKRLGKSRSAISQMFNKTPNISLKKMVEIADAIGLDLRISSPQIHASKKQAEPLGNFRLAETYQEHDVETPSISRKSLKNSYRGQAGN